MASEIRVNTINNSSGLGTITISDTGAVFTGVTTIASLEVTGSLVGVANTAIINTQSVNVSGVVTATSFSGESVNVSGVVTATSFSGDGSALTGLSSDAISEGNTSAEVVDTGSDGHFKVITEGTEALRVDPSQRLLVGTSTVSAYNQYGQSPRAQVVSSGGSLAGLLLEASSSDGNNLVFRKSGGSAGSNTVVTNNQEIGTIRFTGTDGTNPFDVARIATEIDGTPGTNDMPGRLVFSTTADGASSPTERMRISSSGDIGINGTTNPNYPLTFANTSSRNAGIDYTSGASDTNLDLVSLGKGTGWEGQIRFFTSVSSATASERMRITSDGVLRFGQTTTNTPSQSATAGISLSPQGNVNAWRDGGSAGTFGRAQDGVVVQWYRGGSQVGTVTVASGSVSYNTTSDYRLKENVVPLTGAADRVNQLQVHRFNFIAEPDRTVDGFLAHEAQAVVPECVTGTHNEVEVWKEGEELPDGVSVGDNKLDEDGNTIPVYQGIDQSKLVPLLTAALQEALAKIETLETEKADILARLDAAGI